jgi:hypothetical protein
MPNSVRLGFIIGLSVLTLGLVYAESAANKPQSVSPEEQAFQRYGGKLKKIVPAQDSYWKERFNATTFYYLDIYNAGSQVAGRNFFYYVLVITPTGQSYFIENSEDAVTYLERYLRVRPRTAQELMQLFTHLRRVQLLNKPTDLANPLATEQEIVPPVFNKINDEKHMQFYILDDPETTTVVKCELFITPEGKIRYQQKEVSSRAAYQ